MSATHRLVRLVCDDCGRDWHQYTHDDKEVPCIRCDSDSLEERPIDYDRVRQ